MSGGLFAALLASAGVLIICSALFSGLETALFALQKQTELLPVLSYQMMCRN